MIIYSSSVKKVIRKRLKFIADPVYRQRQIELRRDLQKTRREVEKWASEGVHLADPNRLFGIASFTNLPMHAKFHSLIAKVVQLRGYTPVIFTWSGCTYARECFRLFGIEHVVGWDMFVKLHRPDPVQIQRIVEDLWPGDLTISKAKEIQFRGVEVGKHALSVTSRRRVEGHLDLMEFETTNLFREQLRDAVQSVLVGEALLDKYPVEKLVVRDVGYIPNGAIFETALRRGSDSVVHEVGQRRNTWIFKRYDPSTKGLHYFSLSDATWEKVKRSPWTDEDDVRIEAEFSGRYTPDSTDDTRRLQAGKIFKSAPEVTRQLGLDPRKKTAVIFSHVAWDAAFFYGTCLFDDLEDWLYQTVEYVARECPQMNWIVKIHPFNVFKLQRETVEETSEMRLLRPLLPPPHHVKIVSADTDINTKSLFGLVDYVLTVNGTVGMEFPCFGIPAVLAGTGRYNGRGFTIEPRNQAEYFSLLRNLHKVPRLTIDQQILARKHFHALVVKRQVSFEDVAPMELKRIHEAQSNVHDNISIVSRSLSEFESADSVRRLGHWLTQSDDPDFLES